MRTNTTERHNTRAALRPASPSTGQTNGSNGELQLRTPCGKQRRTTGPIVVCRCREPAAANSMCRARARRSWRPQLRVYQFPTGAASTVTVDVSTLPLAAEVYELAPCATSRTKEHQAIADLAANRAAAASTSGL